MTNPIQRLQSLGQSLWYDNIQRHLLENGELAAMIARGDIRGVTSNPTIFQHAIGKSADYDSALLPLAWAGWNAQDIFWELAIEDIRAACDLFAPLYRESEGGDGYVSIEVDPTLAHDTERTLAQVKSLWERIGRENLMVKIPATKEGIPAVRAAIAAGSNVNVTLIFSLARYQTVMDAYLAGLEERIAAGLPVQQIASVASFFVSRMDTKVDSLLDAIGSPAAKSLRGKAAIAYTKLAYQEFDKVFHGAGFARCRAAGCQVQRPLWASTSTKDPAFPDTLYVSGLIAPETVNTVPPKTLDAFRDHGKAAVTILDDLDGARLTLSTLESLGISLEKVTAELEEEGVKSFSESFDSLLKTIEEKRSAGARSLGPLAASAKQRVADLVKQDAPDRLWAHDPSLWTTDAQGQAEISKRLGWLDLPRTSRAALKEINDFVVQTKKDGLDHALLLGMGGSSLAPEVLSLIFSSSQEAAAGKVKFAILDSTDPDQVLETGEEFLPAKTLYIVSSKSGGTAEVNALFNYFWKQAGGDGNHFVAITDPGTSLEKLAREHNFRKIFLADSTVGGRFSALSHFGLVPAALIGYDIERLLDRAAWMMRQCAADVNGERNPGLALGAILGQAATEGRDKLTLLADESIAPLGAWLEQLIDESSGKQGKGILVIDGEPPAASEDYGQDRLFVYLCREGTLDSAVEALRRVGRPVLTFGIADAYELGAEFYRWETATAFACAVMGINAFDQPDVQDSKTRTVKKIDAYSQYNKLEEGKPIWEADKIKAFSNQDLLGGGLTKSLLGLLSMARRGDYVAINAYLPRSARMASALEELRLAIREKTGCATTVGFGPRFLHSTGQLHKGGPDSGVFLQITVDPAKDVEIPDWGLTFGVLERAQALGDYEALVARNRRILRLHLPSDETVAQLAAAIKQS